MSWHPRLRGRDGFTLIETLVAFTVMATLLSVLFRGVVQMRAGANVFDERTIDALVARAVLDEAIAARDMRPGRTSGEREGRHWTLVATPIDFGGQIAAMPAAPSGKAGSGPDSPPPEPPRWAPQRLVVRVVARGRPIEIETVRLAKVLQP